MGLRTLAPDDRDRAVIDMARDAGAWFRQPVVWLGGLIFLVSLGACVATIVLALHHADVPVEAGSGKVMGVPLRDPVAAPPPAPGPR